MLGNHALGHFIFDSFADFGKKSTTKTRVWASLIPKMKNQAADDGCLNEPEENNLKKSCYGYLHFWQLRKLWKKTFQQLKHVFGLILKQSICEDCWEVSNFFFNSLTEKCGSFW